MILMCASGAWGVDGGVAGAAGASLPRSDVVRLMQTSADLGGELTVATEAERNDAMTWFANELQSAAEELLSPNVAAVSEHDLVSAASQRITLLWADHEYLKVCARMRVLDLKVLAAYQQRFGRISDEVKRQLELNIGQLISGLRAGLEESAVGDPPYFSKAEVGRHLGVVEKRLRNRLGDPNSYWLTRPVPNKRLEELLTEFRKRLAQGRTRIPRLLAAGPATKADDGVSKRSEVLEDITRDAVRIFVRESTDPERAVDRTEDFAPGYDQTRRKMAQIADRLKGRPKRPGE